jgi:phosphatidylglycerol---prolipoprotein diacylglyceryl transferase
MLYFYQNLPLHISPIAFTIEIFSIRWYALSYIMAFFVVYILLIWRTKHDSHIIAQISNSKFIISDEISNSKSQNYNKIQNTILDFLLVAFFSALVGGRIGYVLLYNLPYFLAHPISIVSPYENGNFTGIYGMSYHGGLLGVAIGSWIFLRVKKIDFWQWADFIIPAVSLSYFFGRVGNFLNGELYGRVTDSPLGMYFSNDKTVLRWPSQLIEAFLEGIVLFVILWTMRKKEMPKGSLFAIYLIGYGFLRILAEIFREPDPQIGLFLNYFTLGQLLSLPIIFIGAVFIILKKQKI